MNDPNELHAELREGVEKMRSTPPPPKLMEQTLEAVRRRRKIAGRGPRRALLALVALLLAMVSMPLWVTSPEDALSDKDDDRVGHVKHHAGAFSRNMRPVAPEKWADILKRPAVQHPFPDADPKSKRKENEEIRKGDPYLLARPRGAERANRQPDSPSGEPSLGFSPRARTSSGQRRSTVLFERYKRLLRGGATRAAISVEELNRAREAYMRAVAAERLGLDREKLEPQVWKRGRHQPTFARVDVGNGNTLELVSLHVSVTVEGPRARTLVDHVFRNPHDRQLEGTFEYPLPAGASPSYFAMFLGQTRATPPPRFARRGQTPPLSAAALARLTPAQFVKHVSTNDWGRLQEARVVAKDKALETYEDVVRGKVDPALLEHAGGNTFRGRVFPIPRKGYNRVLIAYEELLPVSRGRAIYRFPLPDCKLAGLQFTLQANSRDCKAPAFRPLKAEKSTGKYLLSYTHAWKGKGPGGDALFSFRPPRPEVQAISGRQGDNGPNYLYARLRPRLVTEKAAPFAKHAVFLLDASLSERSGRFATSVKLLRKILESDSAIERFNVLTFNVGAAWIQPGWLKNSAAGREKALKRLDGLVLEGATDFSAALDKVVAPGLALKKDTPLNVFVLSDGQITWGESNVDALVSRFEQRCPYPTRFHCYRTGLGGENLELFEALTRQGGGIFNCFNDADLKAAARAHRQQCWRIDAVTVEGDAARDVLVAGRKAAIYPNGDLIVAARLTKTGRITLKVEGTFLGKRMTRRYTVKADGDSELAARGWAEIAVSSLLAVNDPRLDSLITAYCQQFGIASRVASFLVLENDNDYKRLNLQAERGKTAPGDLNVFLAKAWEQMGRVLSPQAALKRFLARVNPRVKVLDDSHVTKLLALLTERDFELPQPRLDGPLTRREDVPARFEKALGERRREVSIYIKEARRRLRAGDTAGAVRVLSSVVEEHPGRGDALRLVGYRLLDLRQPGQAVRLFGQVQRQRPFEPHSYRDLARSLEECGKYGLAAVQYEVVLAGTWHTRFGAALKLVVREEYARMLREALTRKAVAGKLGDHFATRLRQLTSGQERSDLRVTISWNTDATDVDLWVVEPDGTKCFYRHNRTKNGGELTQDQTQGYGPERYRIKDAAKGEYRVLVHYFRPNANLIAGETHVNVVITRFAGTAQEVTERHTVILKKRDEAVEVTRIKF